MTPMSKRTQASIDKPEYKGDDVYRKASRSPLLRYAAVGCSRNQSGHYIATRSLTMSTHKSTSLGAWERICILLLIVIIYINNRCTGQIDTTECKRVASGSQILPPVMTGKVTTRHKFGFKYGRIEVRVKLPAGNWLIPGQYTIIWTYWIYFQQKLLVCD